MGSTAEIRKGAILNMDGSLFTITDFLHVKPGKGGAFIRTTLKNVVTGKVLDKTFRSGEKIDFVKLDIREMQYLYIEAGEYVFMDQETFEQIHVPSEVVGDASQFLKEAEVVTLSFHEDRPLLVQLPFFMNLRVVETIPGFKGDTVTNQTKPATLETGAVVQVPLFIEENEIIRVDTRTGEYMERVR